MLDFNLKLGFTRFWNSPTIMTWVSYATKSASIILVTPLILTKFNTLEVMIWYLFASILTLTGIADFGFRFTFIRLISYANGGASSIDSIKEIIENKQTETNWGLIERIFSNMKRIYGVLSVCLFVVLLLVGYLTFKKPLENSVEIFQYSIAWLIISITVSIDFYGKIYLNYLEGLNHIARVRRVESVFKIFVILLSFFVLLFFPSVLNLAISISVGFFLNFLRNLYIARSVNNGKLRSFTKHSFEMTFFKKVWEPAWKTGISSLIGTFIVNISSLFYAQIGSESEVASYLLALRFLNEIKNISNAPFYSKIPFLAKLRAQGKGLEFISVAQKGMMLSHFIFIISIVVLTISIDSLLILVKSNIAFVEFDLWLLMCVAFYLHRYGAMHIQLYATSNHVISHIADGVTGILFIGFNALFLQFFGIYALPLSMLVSYLLFYCWYSGYNSYKLLNMSFFEFERKASLFPMFTFIVSFLLIFLYERF